MKWIKATEELPKPKTDILLYFGNMFLIAQYDRTEQCFRTFIKLTPRDFSVTNEMWWAELIKPE